MIEWIQNAKEWISDRVQERTSWDAMLIGVGLVGLLFQGLVTCLHTSLLHMEFDFS